MYVSVFELENSYFLWEWKSQNKGVCVHVLLAGWLATKLPVPRRCLLQGGDHIETIYHGATQVIIMTHSISLRSSLLILALNVVYWRIWAIYETRLFTLGLPLSFSTHAWQLGLGNLCLASMNRFPLMRLIEWPFIHRGLLMCHSSNVNHPSYFGKLTELHSLLALWMCSL